MCCALRVSCCLLFVDCCVLLLCVTCCNVLHVVVSCVLFVRCCMLSVCLTLLVFELCWLWVVDGYVCCVLFVVFHLVFCYLVFVGACSLAVARCSLIVVRGVSLFGCLLCNVCNSLCVVGV